MSIDARHIYLFGQLHIKKSVLRILWIWRAPTRPSYYLLLPWPTFGWIYVVTSILVGIVVKKSCPVIWLKWWIYAIWGSLSTSSNMSWYKIMFSSQNARHKDCLCQYWARIMTQPEWWNMCTVLRQNLSTTCLMLTCTNFWNSSIYTWPTTWLLSIWIPNVSRA
jgi:hypothetical protein